LLRFNKDRFGLGGVSYFGCLIQSIMLQSESFPTIL